MTWDSSEWNQGRGSDCRASDWKPSESWGGSGNDWKPDQERGASSGDNGWQEARGRSPMGPICPMGPINQGSGSDCRASDWKPSESWGGSGKDWKPDQERGASSGDNRWQETRGRSRSGCRGQQSWGTSGRQHGSGNSWDAGSWKARGWQSKRQDGWKSGGEKKREWKDSGWQDTLTADLLEKIKFKLEHLPPGSHVAIVSLQGSLCPITLSHVMCCVEARNMLIHPHGIHCLETFSEILGFIGCNSDVHVSGKLRRLYPPVDRIISWEDRHMLVQLATEDHDWLHSVSKPFDAFQELQSLYSNLHMVFFEVIGADNALSEKKWRRVTDKERIIIMGRAADPGQDNGTDAVCRAMRKDKQRREDLKDKEFDSARHTPLCIWGPELPAISSTAARKALQAGDSKTLSTMLHPSVTEWNLRAGPYAPTY